MVELWSSSKGGSDKRTLCSFRWWGAVRYDSQPAQIAYAACGVRAYNDNGIDPSRDDKWDGVRWQQTSVN